MSDPIQWLGTYMSPDGPIEVREDMPHEQMWTVVQFLIGEREATREQHLRDLRFMSDLRRLRS